MKEERVEKMCEELKCNAPRVTKAQIDALEDTLVLRTYKLKGSSHTVTLAELPGGFVVGKGFAMCVDPDNYRQSIGEEVSTRNALIDARSKLWELEGYRLSCKLIEENKNGR